SNVENTPCPATNRVAEDKRIYFSLTPFQLVAASAAIVIFLLTATVYLHGKFENVSNEFVDVRKDLRDIDVKLAVNSTKLDALDDNLKHILDELKYLKNHIEK
ncbi:MAG: hypothetical protein VW417_08245, partial [Alphaproteobacteria bacterium]